MSYLGISLISMKKTKWNGILKVWIIIEGKNLEKKSKDKGTEKTWTQTIFTELNSLILHQKSKQLKQAKS